MLSPVILRFSRPNSCLILLFFLSYLHHLPCALSQPDLRLCDALFHCGNLTAGFPFWGEARPEPCGHPSLGLRCQQKSNLTYLIISGLMYRVFQIDNSTNTLGLARQDFLGESFCSATLTGTRLTSELFEVLPDYKTIVVYYLCETQLHNSTNFACPKIGVASVNRNNENQERCGASFNITVPTKYVPEEDALNLTRLGSVLKEGFEVKLKIDARPCKKCQSSGGICAYEVATPICCKTNSSGSVINCSRMIPSKSSVDKHHKHCARRFSCGNQIALSYPFWTPEREECGHPEFMVNCTGDFAEFSISSVKFQILDYHYESGIIKLDRKDYHNNLCPQYPENAAINQDVLPFPHDTMLSILYYNCADPVVKVPPSFHIRRLHCEDDDIGGHSYFVLSASRSWDRAILEESSASCERNVSIPVSRSALRIEDGNPTLEAIKKALDDGFGLTLNSDCFGCLGSGGFCGHNVSSRAFVCYCVDGPHEHTCDNSEKQKTEIAKTSHSEKAKGGLPKKAKIGIGFACGFLGATLLAVGLFCFINRRRKNLAAQNTSKDLSTETPYSSNYTMSTTPTSTTTFGSKHSLVQSISNLANGSLSCGFLGSVATGLLMFMIFSLGLRKRNISHHPRYQNIKALIQLKQYSYAEVKKITKSFSNTVGKGGFGTVYGGKLCDGRKVAVKILKEFNGNGEDFINEVASMSQTSHVNIVSLLGFCYEGSKRAIVYEFLENGSLHQFISKKNSLSLDVSTLHGIALGVARGLEYLHHGCKTRIVHFDIKPQNVLLDNNLCPKVSDFGLAKLCEKRQSVLSLLDGRGTIGYIAPEIFSGMYGRVSHKSDVYSYGMMVLEMIGARNKETVETVASNSSSTYFPDWIYKDLENGEHTRKFGDEITREEKEIAKKMILVGLWCIQPCPSSRPPMNRVVEMMEGSLDALGVPPKPSLHLSVAPVAESSWLSEENSSYSEVLI